MLQSQGLSLFTRRLLASIKSAAKEKQHRYPVTGMTRGPLAFFVKEHFAKNHPKDLAEGKNAMKEAAAAWRMLDEASRKKYEELSKHYREDKIREFEALSEEEKQELIKVSVEEKEEKARRRGRKQRRENWEKTGHPERPPSAYNIFVRERYNQLKEKGEVVVPVSKTMQRVSAEWKEMEESTKEPYIKQATKLLDDYKAKLGVWKSKNGPQASAGSKESDKTKE